MRATSSIFQKTLRPSTIKPVQHTAAFSISARRPVLEELVTKLENEISIEKQNDESQSELIQSFLSDSGFSLHDNPGSEEVQLKRRVGDESITVTFSIADLSSSDEMTEALDEDADNAYLDEDINAQSGGANTKGAVNKGRGSSGNYRVAREDNPDPADRPELNDEYDDDAAAGPAFPARVNIKVQREGAKGAMMIEAIAQDSAIEINNVYFFSEAKLADPQTADLEWQRQNVYAGPPFGNLDEDLQVLLERYLDERGIDTRLAQFVPEYIDFKEQKEYVRWLDSKSILMLSSYSRNYLLTLTRHEELPLVGALARSRPSPYAQRSRCQNLAVSIYTSPRSSMPLIFLTETVKVRTCVR